MKPQSGNLAQKARISTGMVGSEFPSRTFGYVGTTLPQASYSASAFGRFKAEGDKVEVNREMEAALVDAVKAALKGRNNGDVPAPSILCADREFNSLGFPAGSVQFVKSIDLKNAFLLVLDNPEFLKLLASVNVNGNPDSALKLLAGANLAQLATVYAPNMSGGGVNRLYPFQPRVSFFSPQVDESY